MNINLGKYIVNVRIIHKNNKNIYFRFDENNFLVVTCPKHTLNSELASLITKNEDALIKMYEKSLEKQKYEKDFHLLGKKYTVSYSEDIDEVTINGDEILAKNESSLNEYIKEETLRIFNEEISICKNCFSDLPEFSLKIRFMKTRWGVCNRRNNTITLNNKLIEYNPKLIDYVIIHEMAHFYEPNHSKAFWNIVAKACPKYKECRKELRK